MKATVKILELDEATGSEIAQVLAATMLQRTPQLDEPDAVVVEEVDGPAPRPMPSFGETLAQDVDPYHELATVAFATAGVDVAAVDAEHEPAVTWRDIPVEFRWWGHNMETCHVRQRPGVDLAMCKLNPAKIGNRYMAGDVPPAETIVHVCGNCRRALVKARRGE